MDFKYMLFIYSEIASAYHGQILMFNFFQHPILSTTGKKILRKQIWKSLHESFDLVYDHLADTSLFSIFFNKFFSLLEPIPYYAMQNSEESSYD